MRQLRAKMSRFTANADVIFASERVDEIATPKLSSFDQLLCVATRN